MNSLAGMMTGGKMHEKKAETCSFKLNIKINGPILAFADLRIPAAKYTANMARKPKDSLKSTEQYQYHDIFGDANLKYDSNSNSRRRYDSKKKASIFFKVKMCVQDIDDSEEMENVENIDDYGEIADVENGDIDDCEENGDAEIWDDKDNADAQIWKKIIQYAIHGAIYHNINVVDIYWAINVVESDDNIDVQ